MAQKHPVRLVVPALFTGLWGMTQNGPDEAVVNLCKWPKEWFFHSWPDNCLAGTSSWPVYLIIAIGMVGGIIWFFWPDDADQLPPKVLRWMWHFKRSSDGYVVLKFERVFPLGCLIPLPRATAIAYERLRNTLAIRMIKSVDGNNPEKMPGVVANMLFDRDKKRNLRLFGKQPPSEQIDEIPSQISLEYLIADNAAYMYDGFSAAFEEETPIFTDLMVLRHEFRNRLKEMTR
jgi:hypothetical protein